MPFGQLVVGPPGAGKSTYCAGLAQFLAAAGRPVAVVSLDPAADPPAGGAPPPAVDVRDLVSLERVQAELGLGPNGGLVYCIEYLEANQDWLHEQLAPLEAAGAYILFDCPGQAELFTLHGALRRIIDNLARKRDYRLVAVQLIDAHLCADPGKYLAALVHCLSTMLHLELPQVNVLSKFDLLARYGALTLGPAFYLKARGLERLAEDERTLPPRLARLTRALAEVVEDFGLVQFCPLAIEDAEAVAAVVAQADLACGYAGAAAAAGEAEHPALAAAADRARRGGGGDDLWERLLERYSGGGGGEEGGAGEGGEGGEGTAAGAVRERSGGEPPR